MADTTNATPSAAVDVTAVLKASDLSQVFVGARPVNATVQEGGELMQHPLEDGSQITDHLVFRPTEIVLSVLIPGDYKPVVDEIRQLYRAGTLLVVQTRTGSYSSMALFDMPHEESAETADAVPMTLKFREAVFIKPAQGGPVPKAKRHASTTKRGQVQPKAPTAAPASQGSFLFRHVKVR